MAFARSRQVCSLVDENADVIVEDFESVKRGMPPPRVARGFAEDLAKGAERAEDGHTDVADPTLGAGRAVSVSDADVVADDKGAEARDDQDGEDVIDNCAVLVDRRAVERAERARAAADPASKALEGRDRLDPPVAAAGRAPDPPAGIASPSAPTQIICHLHDLCSRVLCMNPRRLSPPSSFDPSRSPFRLESRRRRRERPTRR